MNRAEELLKQNKVGMDHLEVPENLESRLRTALIDRPLPQRRKNWDWKRNWKMKIVAACVIALLIGTQSDTLAYYGKQLIGYDQVMNGTLQELNKLGKGQTIGKSYEFQNGATLILDGVMLDENQLIAFYTVRGSKEDLDKVFIYGIGGEKKDYCQRSGTGQLNPDETEIKWILSFEPPNLKEKELQFQFEWLDASAGTSERGEISFELDRKEAMGHVLKKRIHQSVNIDHCKIRFESILASPTTTVIRGVIQYSWELAWDQLTGERIRPNEVTIRLLVNGKSTAWQGGGMSTNVDGIRFSHEFDALPTDLEKLQIQMISFSADHDVHEEIALNQEEKGQSVKILGKKILLDEVKVIDGDTYLTISSEDSIVLTSVDMRMDGQAVGLEETLSDVRMKRPDGTIEHTRTLHFPGTGKKLDLVVKRMTYNTNCSEIIDIPID